MTRAVSYATTLVVLAGVLALAQPPALDPSRPVEQQVPPVADTEKPLQEKGETAPSLVRLEFRPAVDQVAPGTIAAQIVDSDETIYLLSEPIITNDSIAQAKTILDETGGVAIDIEFTKDGADRIGELTRKHVGNRLAILVNGRVISAPTIRDPIAGGTARISGNFTAEEAEELVGRLEPDPPFRTTMLLIRSDWSSVPRAKEIEQELREGFQEAEIPDDIRRRLPASAAEMMFPPEITVAYSQQNYYDLYTWLSENELIVGQHEFVRPTPAADQESVPMTDLSWVTSYTPPEGFLSLPPTREERMVGPQPFVSPHLSLQWELQTQQVEADLVYRVKRTLSLELKKRGNAEVDTRPIDQTYVIFKAPSNLVLMCNAFASSNDRAFHKAAQEKGFLPLLICIPTSDELVAGRPAVRPPDRVDTISPTIAIVASFLRTAPPPGLVSQSLPAESEGDSGSRPFVTREVRIENVEVDTILNTMSQLYRDEIVIAGDKSLKSILVRGPDAIVTEVADLIQRIDTATSRTPEGATAAAEEWRSRLSGIYRWQFSDFSGQVTSEELKSRYEATERQARGLAREIQADSSNLQQNPSLQRKQAQLKELVEIAFDLRLALHRAEIDVLESKINDLSKRLDQRIELKTTIIDRRVRDLLRRTPTQDQQEPSRFRTPLGAAVEAEILASKGFQKSLQGTWVLARSMNDPKPRLVRIEGTTWTFLNFERPGVGTASFGMGERDGLSILFVDEGRARETWMGSYQLANDRLAIRFQSANYTRARTDGPHEVSGDLQGWSGEYQRVKQATPAR